MHTYAQEIVRHNRGAVRSQHDFLYSPHQWTVSHHHLGLGHHVLNLDLHCRISRRNLCRLSNSRRSLLLVGITGRRIVGFHRLVDHRMALSCRQLHVHMCYWFWWSTAYTLSASVVP